MVALDPYGDGLVRILRDADRADAPQLLVPFWELREASFGEIMSRTRRLRGDG